MQGRKRILVIGGAALAVLLLIVVAVPVLFEGRIEAAARARVERVADVRVSWSDVGLTLLRDFPNPTLTLSDLAVVGTGRFEADTLTSLASLRLEIGAGSILRGLRGSGPFVVRSVRVEEPVVRLLVAEDGPSNWEIFEQSEGAAAPGEADGGPRDLAVELRSLEITDGTLVLDNARSGLFVSLEGLRHSLRGDFSRRALVAQTSTSSERATVRFGGVPYLPGATLRLDADLDVDLDERRVRLSDNELELNDLLIRFAGEVGRVGEDVALDLGFSAERSDFAQLLSLVPAVYARDFESLETSGTAELEGSVRGTYGESAFPAFALHASVDDARFRYPDLPHEARAISAELSLENPGGDVDSTVVSLSRFHAEIGGQPLDATLTLRTPVSDPEVDARLQGTLDLDALAGTVKLGGVERLAGVVTADAAVRARRSDVDSARYDRVAAEGTVSVRGVTLESPDLRQPVSIEEALVELSPERADVRSFQARLGGSDVRATGSIDNLLGFVLGQAPLAGIATFASRQVLLDEWRSGDELEVIPVPAMLDLTLDGTVERLVFGALEMSNARGRLLVADRRLTLEGFTLETLGGRVGLGGYYETLDLERPAFALDMALDSLDVAGAAGAVATVRALAPVARYARGTFSADLDVSGALDRGMAPILDRLDGTGSLATSRVAIEGFPLLERLAQTLALERLSHPTIEALRSTIRIQDGRLHVDPFAVGVGGLAMSVAGSSGVDQSIDYTLGLTLPRSGIGDAIVGTLAQRASQLGVDLATADSIPLDVRVTGTVSEPAIGLSLGQATTSLRSAAAQAAEAAVERRVDEAEQRLEAERAAARERARARADSIVAGAEQRAAAVRAEARELADRIRAEGNRRADEVLAAAGNPIARAAAEPVAERIRQEADERATTLVREADERADALVAEARAQADALVGPD